MAKITVADVLEHAKRFEDMLANYYADISSHTMRDGVRMLADYMSRHRRRITDFLGKMDPDEKRRIKRIPLPFDPEAADCHCFEGKEISSEAPASEVLDRAVELDQCLVDLYRQVAEEVTDQEAKELFEKLLQAEERDEVRLKRIKAMDYF